MNHAWAKDLLKEAIEQMPPDATGEDAAAVHRCVRCTGARRPPGHRMRLGGLLSLQHAGMV